LAARHKQLLALDQLGPCLDCSIFAFSYTSGKQPRIRTLSALAAALAVELLDALEELMLRLDAKIDQ
jgi:hypothetical protein